MFRLLRVDLAEEDLHAAVYAEAVQGAEDVLTVHVRVHAYPVPAPVHVPAPEAAEQAAPQRISTAQS